MKRPAKPIISTIFIVFAGSVFSFNLPRVREAAAQVPGREDIRIEYKSEGQRDPFLQEEVEIVEPEVEFEPQPLPLLEVQGMVWGGTLPQAIINNKVVKIGDVIEGVRIAAIDKNGITVFFQNQPHILKVPVKKSTDGPDNGQNT